MLLQCCYDDRTKFISNLVLFFRSPISSLSRNFYNPSPRPMYHFRQIQLTCSRRVKYFEFSAHYSTIDNRFSRSNEYYPTIYYYILYAVLYILLYVLIVLENVFTKRNCYFSALIASERTGYLANNNPGLLTRDIFQPMRSLRFATWCKTSYIG